MHATIIIGNIYNYAGFDVIGPNALSIGKFMSPAQRVAKCVGNKSDMK